MAAPTKWTQKNSPFRYFYMTMKQIGLTLRAMVVTTFTMALWYYVIWPRHLCIDKEDSERLMIFSVPALMLSLFFIGGFLYTKIDDRRAHVVSAILSKDKDAFLKLRDERTPNFSLVFQGTLSILLVAHALFLTWDTVWGGLAAVGTVTFIGAKLWVLITYLDDTVGSSKWIQERVPDGWMTEDIDKHFKCDGSVQAHSHAKPEPLPFWRRLLRRT